MVASSFLVAFCFGAGPLGRHSAGAADIWNVGQPQGHIEVLTSLPTPQDFFEKYVRNIGGPFEGIGKPVLFRGAARAMPAFKKWNDDYLKAQHGHVLMDQVETEKRESRTALPHEDWNLNKFLDKYNSSEIYSTATTPKGLDEEVYFLPVMNCGGFSRRLQSNVLWFSSGSTKSVIHNDPKQNIHCMIDGSKEWILWHPSSNIDTPEMGWINGETEAERNPEEFKDAYGVYVGKINVDNVDLKKFPGWGKLKWWKLSLKAGDCAFIPGRWFHFVEAPAQRSVSVHVWFGEGKSFDQKSCDRLTERGHNISDYLIRLSDCTWGYGDPDKQVKQTKCRLPKASKASRLQQEL